MIAVGFGASTADAFTVQPSLVLSSPHDSITTELGSAILHPSLILSDDGVDSVVTATTKTAEAVTDIGALLPEAGGGILDIIKNVAYAITAILFLVAGLSVITASIIVPAAAKELETECKELAPELWDQYSALLKEGETMSNRPDLMQELGAKLQPLLDAKIERQFEEKKALGIDVSEDERAWKAIDSFNDKIPKPDNSAEVFGNEPPSSDGVGPVILSSNQWDDDDDDFVDAEVVKKTNG